MVDNLQMMLKSVQQELKSIKEAQTRYDKEYIQKPSAAAAAASVSGSVEINQEGQLNNIRKAFENMDDILRKLEDVWKNSRRIDDLEQYSWRICLILHGFKIPFQESYSEFESYVIYKLNSKLEISPAITTHDIDTCHVLPSRKKSSNSTPIIIKFVSRSVRNAIYGMKKKLKAKKNDDERLSITESLTRRRLQLLKSAKQTFGLGSAWTLNGNVYCMHRNKRYIIDNFSDIDKLAT